MGMFIFAQNQRYRTLLESSIGGCNRCSSGSMDLVEQRSKCFLFGFIPTQEQVDRIVVCSNCGQTLKEAYYTMRHKQTKNEPSPKKKNGQKKKKKKKKKK